MAVSNSYRDSIKKAIGISAATYDTDIVDKIEEARAEMIRIGVSSEAATNEDDPLVRRAVVTFVHAAYPEDEASAARYSESAEKQMGILSIESDYKAV